MESVFVTMLFVVLVFVVSALPLYLAVKLLGGKTTIFKTILVMFFAGIVTAVVSEISRYGGILGFLVLIWIYREMFRLRWVKAFLVWLLQMVFVFLLSWFLVFWFGLSLGLIVF